MASAIGEDDLGKQAIQKLKSWNVNTDYVNVDKQLQTGQCIVKLDEKGIPTYNLLRNVAYDHIECRAENEQFDALYFGTLSLRDSDNLISLKNLLKNNLFKEVFVDVNIRPPFYSKDSILFALDNATIIKISDEELPILLKTVYGDLSDGKNVFSVLSESFRNLKMIILTMGEKGSVAYDCRKNEKYEMGAKKVTVVSTVGAGDSFSAAFMYSYLSGKNIEECLREASELSAFVVSQKDAIPE